MRVFAPYLLLTAITLTGFVACSGTSTDNNLDAVADQEETAGEDTTLPDAGDTATLDVEDTTGDIPLDACVPQCDGLNCGPDGCGGSCGECPIYAKCVAGDCCMADCEGKECGPDGCGGWCGMCEENSLCIDTLCLLDSDQDGVPNEADVFPNNPDLPGVAEPQTVYAHTDQTLFKMDVKLYLLEEVHDFVWSNDGGAHYVTDIGFDRYGVLYAVTFENLYTCHPQTGVCTLLGDLPEEFNGLTLIPKGYLDPFKDVMVGISEDGGWYRLSVHNGNVEAIKLGEYGGPYTSAGDSYSIMGVGTFAAVHKAGAASDYLVSVNPSNGQIIEEIGPIEGYTGIFGLAGWSGKAYAFDKKGDVVLIDTTTGEIEILHSTEHSWWGAGVATLLN